MTGVAGMVCLVLLVHTWTLKEGRKGSFVDPFVDVDTTLGTFQVSRGFSQQVLAWCRLVWLLVEDLFDLLGTGWLLG